MGEVEPSEAEQAGSLDDPAFQKAVFEQAYRQTCLQLDGGGGIATLSQITKGRSEAIDEVVADFASEKGAECASGCSFCCHQMVLSTPLEIFGIARYILDAKSETEIARLKERLATRAMLPLDVQSRHGADKPCPLLEDNRCSVYEHRPSLCRTMLSTSRSACETSLTSQEQRVPFIAEPVVISFLMQLGIDYALIKLKGLSTEKVELSRALLIALADFEPAFQTWIDGREAFPDCHVETGSGPSNSDLAESAAAQCGVT
ncbi:YkgJ family cysteine cluster protein [Methyloferula stellata]|uniref:YkgJ family cysteine cluster protein n=1 Tax=Methyloferula stellata TaxID=876270 RepID=UPI000370A9DF|nr:YkgJ family cysteine cluster protein [Methyloferula stellata]